MNILMITAELEPLAKTGGLADAVAGLSKKLKEHGHDVRIVMPFYSDMRKKQMIFKVMFSEFIVQMGIKNEKCKVRVDTILGGVVVYFIEHDEFFGRSGIYNNSQKQVFEDNACRFSLLSMAALTLCGKIEYTPDVVHAHDWHTAVSMGYMKTIFSQDIYLKDAKTVLTIHNIQHQGIYPKKYYEYIKMGWEYYTPDKFEEFDQINMLKGGIYFADHVTTVSPTHSKEILGTSIAGHLRSALREKRDNFTGIINGVDYSIWSPEFDIHLPAIYTPNNLKGKKICKKYLQGTFDLSVDNETCLIGAISRFDKNKGFELLKSCIREILNRNKIQFVILGFDNLEMESFFIELSKQYPGKVGAFIGFDDKRAHLIQAGCDLILIPSETEPCGLNQLYSLRYGTLPIVHATGGLEDTVDQYDKFTGMGTGFKFIGYNSQALMDSVDDAVTLYYTKREHFKKMVKTAMKKDFSWYNSVQRYLKVYGEKSTFQDSKIITKKQPASKHVFLSYVQNDIDIVTQIKNLLIRNDINVWQDIDNIEPGDNLEVKILEAIEGSYHFIPCFSESYWDRESTFMNRELRWAIDKYRNMPLGSRWFIPALLEDCQIPPIGIGFGQTIRDLLWADLSKGNINILVDAILNN